MKKFLLAIMLLFATNVTTMMADDVNTVWTTRKYVYHNEVVWAIVLEV